MQVYQSFYFLFFSRMEKITSAVQETSGSRYNEGPIKDPLKPLNTKVNAVMVRGISGGPQWAPMMPRGASFQDSSTSDRCGFSCILFLYYDFRVWRDCK